VDAADIVLMRPDIRSVARVIRLSRRAIRVMRQNRPSRLTRRPVRE